MSKNWIALSQTKDGSASIRKVAAGPGFTIGSLSWSGQYEIEVFRNLQQDEVVTRCFRSTMIGDVMRVAITEIRTDPDFQPPQPYLQAIRHVCFEAEDQAVERETARIKLLYGEKK